MIFTKCDCGYKATTNAGIYRVERTKGGRFQLFVAGEAYGKPTTLADAKDIAKTLDDDRNAVGIKLSSIHKAKGLEARSVFLLEPKGASVPHPMAKSDWQYEQETHIRYVAITRAIDHLWFVGD